MMSVWSNYCLVYVAVMSNMCNYEANLYHLDSSFKYIRFLGQRICVDSH